MTRLSKAARPLLGALTAAALGGYALGATALSGCSGRPAPAQSQAGPIVGDDCPDLVEGAAQVRFTDAHGAKLAGVVFGEGSTGVVLSHMSDGDVCIWMAYARQLAAGGYRVLVYYFHGSGTPAVPTAAASTATWWPPPGICAARACGPSPWSARRWERRPAWPPRPN